MNRFLRPAALAAVALLALTAACGGEESVGDESILDLEQEDQGAFGATTTAPTSTTLPIASPDTAAVTSTTVAQATTTTAAPEQQAVSVEVKMLDSSPYFVDNLVAVPVGGKVRFLNTGTATYRVAAGNGAFDSGPIAPGKAWVWTATSPGEFNYADPDRPFAGGTIQVAG